MNFTNKMKTSVLISSIVSMTFLTGCATYKELDKDKKITIKRTDSIMAYIKRVAL